MVCLNSYDPVILGVSELLRVKLPLGVIGVGGELESWICFVLCCVCLFGYWSSVILCVYVRVPVILGVSELLMVKLPLGVIGVGMEPEPWLLSVLRCRLGGMCASGWGQIPVSLPSRRSQMLCPHLRSWCVRLLGIKVSLSFVGIGGEPEPWIHSRCRYRPEGTVCSYFYGARNWTHGLPHAKQSIFHRILSLVLWDVIFIFKYILFITIYVYIYHCKKLLVEISVVVRLIMANLLISLLCFYLF